MAIRTKRIYDSYEKSDGFRILVDRLWPRGMKKEEARIDLWLKDIAPSTELRQEFHGGSVSWTQFKTKYKSELKGAEALETLKALAKEHKDLTLLFAAKDAEENQATLLKEWIS